MKTSKVLSAAAEYHAEHGSCKGTYRTEDGKVCLLGAIHAAVGVSEYRAFWGTDTSTHSENLEMPEPKFTSEQRMLFIDACRTVQEQLCEDVDDEEVTEDYGVHAYNDREDVSGEDITLLLKRSAERARAKEEAEETEVEE